MDLVDLVRGPVARRVAAADARGQGGSVNPPLSAHVAGKPARASTDKARYHRLKSEGRCVDCAQPLAMGDVHRSTRCEDCRRRPARPWARRARRRALIAERKCLGCLEPLPSGHLPQRCDECAAYRVAQAARHDAEEAAEDEGSTLRTEAVIAREVARGERCARCHILAPCGGHETIEQLAARRPGSVTW